VSAIASLRVIDRAAVVAAPGRAAVERMVDGGGRELDELFPWSGYCMMELLFFLEERGIGSAEPELLSLLGSDGVMAVFGSGDRMLLERLDPRRFRSEELVEAMDGFDFDDAEAVTAATDGLEALRAGIGALNDHELLVVRVR
jgi:hypothetical protein